MWLSTDRTADVSDTWTKSLSVCLSVCLSVSLSLSLSLSFSLSLSPVATLPGAWHYRVRAGTGWPGASIL